MERTLSGKGDTSNKCSIYGKNWLHGTFGEENTACLIRCGTSQMEVGRLGRTPL